MKYFYEIWIILTGIFVQVVDGGSGVVIFNFPRLNFGHFQDALLQNRKTLSTCGGMIEALTYKIQVYPPTPKSTTLYGALQDRTRCFCILSFNDQNAATRWLNSDPLITEMSTWSFSTDVNIIVMETNIDRQLPHSWYNEVHLIGVISSKNQTLFSELVKPEIGEIFYKYGGNKMVDSRIAWRRFIGTSWPSDDNESILYGPMAYRNNFTQIIKSGEVTKLISDNQEIVSSIQLYVMEPFFQSSSGCPIYHRYGQILTLIMVTCLHFTYMYAWNL